MGFKWVPLKKVLEETAISSQAQSCSLQDVCRNFLDLQNFIRAANAINIGRITSQESIKSLRKPDLSLKSLKNGVAPKEHRKPSLKVAAHCQ